MEGASLRLPNFAGRQNRLPCQQPSTPPSMPATAMRHWVWRARQPSRASWQTRSAIPAMARCISANFHLACHYRRSQQPEYQTAMPTTTRHWSAGKQDQRNPHGCCHSDIGDAFKASITNKRDHSQLPITHKSASQMPTNLFRQAEQCEQDQQQQQ